MSTTPRTIRRLVLVAIVLSIAPLGAQQANRVATAVNALHEQIDRIFSARAYESPRFGPARWQPDGTAYAIVESASNGGNEIAKYDAASGARTVLVPASKLIPQGLKTSIDIDDYAWSSDGKRLLIFTNTRRVWRQNTRGDYWVLDTASGALKKIGGDAPESSLMFAKFSPDGNRVAYVRGNNIYVEGISDGRREQLTHDGSDTKVNGTSDWVYEEELDLRDAFRWSPDGRRIAYWQFDTTGVGSFQLINNTAGRYPTTTTIPYPKAGTTNSAVRVGVVTVDGGETQWMQAPGDPRDNYIARVEWADPTTVAIQQLNRLQNRNDYLLADASRGSVTRAYRDENKAWVDVDEVRWVNGGKAFLWVSERDGWRHIYRVARGATSSDAAQLITNFRADVIDVTGLDEAGGWVYFTASPTNATQQYLYRSKLDGSGTPERLTPADQPGWHTYDLAPGGRLAFHTYSRIDRPPVTDVVDLPGHRSLRALTNPSALNAKLASVVKVPTEFISVDVGGGVSLDGWMVKPSSFDASRKYPVIAYIYGEVASQTVRDRWGGGTALFNRALADAGYVVVSFDNRGTPAPKGAEWRKVVYGSLGDLSSKEQAAAMRAMAAKYSFVDGDHMGIWGWSGGGSNTLNAMFRFPDLYKVGVAIAPMPDQQLYDSIYEERYMGLPKDNAEGYRLGSPINFAEGLKGKLLIIHGTGDDNVHYQGTERLINRLVALGKPFDMMAYPNRTHSISEGPGTTPHLYHLIARYFTDHLPPNP